MYSKEQRTENKGTACFPSDRICYRCGTSTCLSQQRATVYHNDNKLVLDTLDQAMRSNPDAHPLLHSDRGFQYTSRDFHVQLQKHGIFFKIIFDKIYFVKYNKAIRYEAAKQSGILRGGVITNQTKESEISKMKTQVRYFSQTGNTKRLADAIAAAADTQALTIDTPIAEKTDLLFLGAAVYWAGIDRKVKDFIASLDPKKVGRVAIFSNSALAERAYPSLAKALTGKGIRVEKDNFYCCGQFKLLHRGRPNTADIEDAYAFAKRILLR